MFKMWAITINIKCSQPTFLSAKSTIMAFKKLKPMAALGTVFVFTDVLLPKLRYCQIYWKCSSNAVEIGWSKIGFLMRHSRNLFFFISVFSTVNSKYVHYKFSPMPGFKLRTSGVGSDRSANQATTKNCFFCKKLKTRRESHASKILSKYLSAFGCFP